MAYFPFMIDLEKKRCVIAGAGKVAVRKAEQMIEFGADVTVVAPDICVQMRTLFEGKKNQMCLIQRKITKEDIVSADVVIMATNQPAVNEEMAAFCKEQRILVNVVDVKKDCGFYFPAIIKEEDVVISVSTGGCSPLLASGIKKEIQQGLSKDYGSIARKMGQRRQKIIDMVEDPAERKRLLKEMLIEIMEREEE